MVRRWCSAGNTIENSSVFSLIRIRLYLQCFDTVNLFVGRQEGHPACKNWGGDGGGACTVSSDGVAPSRMVAVSASVNLPLHHKVQKFSFGTG